MLLQAVLEAMTDAERLVKQASSPPWIRPWADLRVRGIGDNDLLGRDVKNDDLSGIGKAQSNLDLAVYAVNHLADYEALTDALAGLLRARQAYIDAVNGKGHPGEEHDEALVHASDKDAEWRVIDVVGDCAGCGGAQYGTEDEMNHFYDEAEAALLRLRPKVAPTSVGGSDG